jgi:hypothetical protein
VDRGNEEELKNMGLPLQRIAQYLGNKPLKNLKIKKLLIKQNML